MDSLYVDFNSRERLPDGGQAVGIPLGSINPAESELRFKVGCRVILYDEEIRCEGILRHGNWLEGWVADIVPGTVERLQGDEYRKLRAETRRLAIRAT
jgi:hypothetical protein